MTLTEGTPVTYGEKEIGKYEYSMEHRIHVLKRKVLDKTVTTEEKEELQLLVA